MKERAGKRNKRKSERKGSDRGRGIGIGKPESLIAAVEFDQNRGYERPFPLSDELVGQLPRKFSY